MLKKKPMAYFLHGLPGSPRDAELLHRTVTDKYQVVPLEYLASHSDKDLNAILQDFDADLMNRDSNPVKLFGFSLGAMVAIHLAAARPEKVESLILISPAAPLSLGKFLPDMAGKPIFTLAQKSPRTLARLTYLQATVARFAPHFLIKQLFQKSGVLERQLLADPSFQNIVANGMRHSFTAHRQAYLSLLQLYVSDWSTVIDEVQCPVEIWHGAQDKWAPLAMSHALCREFQKPAKLQVIPDAEHYSTLSKTLICPPAS